MYIGSRGELGATDYGFPDTIAVTPAVPLAVPATQSGWANFATTALPSILQSGAQIATALSTRAPVGVTPQYGLPVYPGYPQQQYQQSSMFGSFGNMDATTMAMLAGGALLLIVMLKRK
jgi:hypothetical protein